MRRLFAATQPDGRYLSFQKSVQQLATKMQLVHPDIAQALFAFAAAVTGSHQDYNNACSRLVDTIQKVFDPQDRTYELTAELWQDLMTGEFGEGLPKLQRILSAGGW
jgi:hypothetical protein